MNKILLFLLLALPSNSLFALHSDASFQLFSNQNEYQIELKDAETLEPISYATVRFGETNRGIVADYYGQFRLPYSFINNYKNIEITSIGYSPLKVEITSLSKTEINTFKMVTKTESLEMVYLNGSKKRRESTSLEELKRNKSLSALEIVRKAVKQIPFNMNKFNHSYVGYYRDYQKVKNEYYNLNEGILEQFDAGINTNKISDSVNRSAFYSFKKNVDFKTDSIYLRAYDGINKFVEDAQIDGYGGNELSILNTHNPIRNYNKQTFSFVYQLNNEFLKLHEFNKGDIVYENNEPIIIVEFNNKINSKNPSTSSSYRRTSIPNYEIPELYKVKGNLKISLSDFSIYEFNYSIIDENKIDPMFNVNIEYRKQNNKMYLNYITFNNRFVIEDDRDVFKEVSVFYYRNIGAFEIIFNNEVDKTTIKAKNFKIKFKGENVKIRGVRVWNSRITLVYIKPPVFDKYATDVYPKDMRGFDFIMKNIKNSNGIKIYKKTKTVGHQFREFFVQEVFENKKLEDHLKYIEKEQPLYIAPVNDIGINKGYIINSPLKSTRTN